MNPIEQMLQKVCEYLDEKQAENIKSYNLEGRGSITDFVIITNGKNVRHLQSLADDVVALCMKDGFELKGMDGVVESGWIILDFADFLVHLFTEEKRDFYSLERLYDEQNKH
ncbi:ribosome silencing factor [Guggenheimella bovis]